MTDHDPVGEIDPRFSSEGAVALPWSELIGTIEDAELFWLSTVRGDGRPHVTPLPAIWLDEALHFCTGTGEQKARNLDRNPRCALTTGCNRFQTGLDVVVEGTATRVIDSEMLERLAARWLSKLDWRFEVVDGGFRDAQVAGAEEGDAAATAYVFSVAPDKVLAFVKGEPFSQTRFQFG